MVTADAEVETTQPSEPVTPASPESQSPPSTEEVTPSPSGEETHEITGQESAPEPTLQDLDRLFRGKKLTDPDLLEKRETLRTAENDRIREYQNYAARQDAEENARLQQLASLEQTTLAEMQQTRERIMSRPLDEQTAAELIADADKASVAKLVQATRDLHLAPHEKGIRGFLLQAWGDSPRNRQALQQMELPQLAEALVDVGRRMGPDAKSTKVSPVTEWHKDGYHTSSYTKGQDDLKAAHPEIFGNAPPAIGGFATSGRKHYSQMTYEERSALSPAERDAAVAREAAERK